MAKCKVIAGDYEGNDVGVKPNDGVYIDKVDIRLNKSTVDSYEVLNEEQKKSAMTTIGRGLGGALILGPVGLLAGLSAKSNNTYTVSITFKDGKRSLLEINQFIYSYLVKSMF
jgi:hypothetical protein